MLSSEMELYGKAFLSFLSFSLVVGLLYWFIRLGCAHLFTR